MTDDADEVGESEATNAAGAADGAASADETASGGGAAETAGGADGTAADAADDRARTDDQATTGGQATTAATSDEERERGPATEGDDLAARVAEFDDDLASEVADLEARAESLATDLEAAREEVEDLTERLKRKQADFQNYKKRAKKRQEQIRETATEDFVERVVTVRDNMVRALDQDEDADIRPGVESTLTEFDRILEDEGVSVIDPDPGVEVDPHRHEVMMRVEADQPSGTVADVYQPGYEMGEKVIRAAQITVSDDE